MTTPKIDPHEFWWVTNSQGNYGVVGAVSARVLSEVVGQKILEGWAPCGGVDGPPEDVPGLTRKIMRYQAIVKAAP